MVRLRIDLAYDGGPFAGFARQDDQVTVQGTLEGALTRLLGSDVETTCAGRTDRGVHATAQVVHLDVDETVPRVAGAIADLRKMRYRIDRLCGDAISIWEITEVDADFDARFSARSRSYRYRLIDAAVADPRLRSTRVHVPKPLDVEPMHEGVQHLLGEHDYAAFCRKAEGKHTVRRIDEAAVIRDRDEVHVTMRGRAFCHHQVRSIVGSLIEVGQGDRDPMWIKELLEGRDRTRIGRVAPARGLTLEGVGFVAPYPPSPPPSVAPYLPS